MTTYQLTNDQLQVLGSLILQGNRAGMYLQLYDYTVQAGAPSNQVAVLAQISSLSDLLGDTAVYANSLAAAEASLSGATYPGLIPFSPI
jgi:hypothetical protein